MLEQWLKFLAMCLVGAVMPSVLSSLFRFSLSDKARRIFFPLRTLTEKKVLRKGDLLSAFCTVVFDGGVNGIAVIWYVFAAAAAVVFVVLTVIGNAAAVRIFLFAVLFFLLFCLAVLALGVFFGDKKYRTRIPVKEASAESIHFQENAMAMEISREMQQEEAELEKAGLHWHIDVLCTDHLDDKPNTSVGGYFATLTGVPQTSPIYMSRIVATVLDKNEQEVPFPIRRSNQVDISYTSNQQVTVMHDKYIVERVLRIIRDMTPVMIQMMEKAK